MGITGCRCQPPKPQGLVQEENKAEANTGVQRSLRRSDRKLRHGEVQGVLPALRDSVSLHEPGEAARSSCEALWPTDPAFTPSSP